jgi:putative transposase
MARKRHTPEEVVNLLRQVEVSIANGKTTGQACKEALITEQTYYRWRKEYGGLQVDQAKRLKELEQENSKLKRLVANLSLEKLVLKDIAEGNVWSAPFLQAQVCFWHIAVCVNVSGLSRVGRFWRPAMMRFAHAVPNNLVRS